MIDDRIAKHNARVLAAAQALGGASLADRDLARRPRRLDPRAGQRPRHPAGQPRSSSGSRSARIPAAILMRRLGRRNGYILGALRRRRRLPRGGGVAFRLRPVLRRDLRRAASTPPSSRATASPRPTRPPTPSGRVRSPGSCAAASRPRSSDPQTVIWTRDLVPGAAVRRQLSWRRPRSRSCRSSSSRSLAPAPPRRTRRRSAGGPCGRSYGSPASSRRLPPASSSYGLMSFVMTAAPLAMVECGHSVGTAALGIQWHVLAHVRPELPHRPADRPLRQGARHRGRARPDRRRRRDRPFRPVGRAISGSPSSFSASAGTSASSARRRS